MSEIYLLVEYFIPTDIQRQREIFHCLKKNHENPQINHIVCFTEIPVTFDEMPKIIVVMRSQRMTYKDFFVWSNEEIPHGSICMIANADIYLKDISKLSTIDLSNKFIAQVRWELNQDTGDIWIDRRHIHDSQDTWIYATPLKIPSNSDFYLGIPGCDNRIAYEIDQQGYQVLNLPHDIITIHYHRDDFREYHGKSEQIKPPWKVVYPTKLQ